MNMDKKSSDLLWKIAVVILLFIVAVQLYWLRGPSASTATATTVQAPTPAPTAPPVKPLLPLTNNAPAPVMQSPSPGINPYDQPQLRSGAELFNEMQRMVDQMMQEMDRDVPVHLFGTIQDNHRPLAYSGPAMTSLPDKYVVKLEMPGMEKGSIDASVTDNVLNITGKQENTVDRQNGSATSYSNSVSHFQTSLYLPEPVKADELKVDYAGNTVTITIPKK